MVNCDSGKMEQVQKGDVIIEVLLDSSVSADMKGNEARSEGTYRIKIRNFSKLKDIIVSPPCYIRNLPWKISVTPFTKTEGGQTQRYLSFFVRCDSESKSSSWSCRAKVDFRLISVKPGIENFSSNASQLLYCSKDSDWGFPLFMTWTDVLDPEQGYIKNDEIILEVYIVADAPNLDKKEQTDERPSLEDKLEAAKEENKTTLANVYKEWVTTNQQVISLDSKVATLQKVMVEFMRETQDTQNKRLGEFETKVITLEDQIKLLIEERASQADALKELNCKVEKLELQLHEKLQLSDWEIVES